MEPITQNHTDNTQNNVIDDLQTQVKANQTLMGEGKYDEAIESYRLCCEKARDHYNDEMHHEMAKFYYLYGNAVLYKIEESGEIFGEVVEKAENQKNDDELGEIAEENSIDDNEESNNIKNNKELNVNQVICESNDTKIIDETNETTVSKPEVDNVTKEETAIKNDIKPIDDVDFLQVAWENLEVARVITEKRYEEILKNPDFNKDDVEKLLKQQAKIYLRLGDLECWKENFQDGLSEYKKSLEIRRKFENPILSRDISELHFLIGNAHLYIGKDDCEEKALESYDEAKIIMENNLKQELGIPMNNHMIFGATQPFDRNLINESPLDSDAAKDLKSTLKMLYEKIEDTIQQKSEKRLLQLEKEKMKENSLKENNFINPNENTNNKENIQNSFPNPNIGKETKDETKIVNLGVFGNSRKRPINGNTNNNEKNIDGVDVVPSDKKMKLPDV